jgi:hypothetical protein
MPDEPIQLADGKVYTPSPEPGEPTPQRRLEDTKSYSKEWMILGVALAGWAGAFCTDIAAVSAWKDIFTPKFVGIHAAQLLSVMVAVITANRIPSKS